MRLRFGIFIIISLWLALFLRFATAQAQGVPAAPTTEGTAANDPCLMDAQCKALVDSGRVLSQAQQYEGACLAYKAAYARKPMPWLLINIGRMEQRLGLYKAAIDHYRTFIELTREQGQDALLQKGFQFLRQAEDELARQDARAKRGGSTSESGAEQTPGQSSSEGDADLTLPSPSSAVRYQATRGPRPIVRLVLGSLLLAGGASMLGGGAALLGLNGSCSQAATPPSQVCPAVYSTLTPGLSLTLVGVGTLAAGIVTIALPGPRIFKPVVTSPARLPPVSRSDSSTP